LQAKQNNPKLWSIHCTIYKTQLKMHHRPKFKPKTTEVG
jgi:hypothetical protein